MPSAAASVHRRDFSQHPVVFSALGFDELRHLGALFDDVRHYLDAEGIPSGWAPVVLCEALSRDRAFPGEKGLIAQYGVSRTTAREALRALRTEGLVTAERGRRPRLSRPTEIAQPLGALYSLFASVETAGLRQSGMVRKLDVRADGVVAVRLGLEESTPLLHLERLRLAGEEPLALDRVWLPASFAKPLLAADFTHTSLYDQLATRTGVRHQQRDRTRPRLESHRANADR